MRLRKSMPLPSGKLQIEQYQAVLDRPRGCVGIREIANPVDSMI
jgi:hypothetical protein